MLRLQLMSWFADKEIEFIVDGRVGDGNYVGTSYVTAYVDGSKIALIALYNSRSFTIYPLKAMTESEAFRRLKEDLDLPPREYERLPQELCNILVEMAYDRADGRLAGLITRF